MDWSSLACFPLPRLSLSLSNWLFLQRSQVIFYSYLCFQIILNFKLPFFPCHADFRASKSSLLCRSTISSRIQITAWEALASIFRYSMVNKWALHILLATLLRAMYITWYVGSPYQYPSKSTRKEHDDLGLKKRHGPKLSRTATKSLDETATYYLAKVLLACKLAYWYKFIP